MTQQSTHNSSPIPRSDAHDFAMPDISTRHTPPGINKEIVATISQYKKEPRWMRDKRLRAYDIFTQKPLPTWGPSLDAIDFDNIVYFRSATDRHETAWEDVPAEIRETYDRIGVPEHEKKWLAGVSAQYDSTSVYESMERTLAQKGVLFCDMDTAVEKYPDIVQKYFGKLIPPSDNTFAALNTAVWSGGSFVYVPRGVHITMPLQAYFRINAERFGQFERTLIIAEEDASVHYIEGCTAPTYSTQSLHAAVVEIFAHKNARVRYSTIQNWSTNIHNLVTKRAKAEENATVEWIDCNIGSGVTMKYPAVILAGAGARGDMLSMALAGKNQVLDTGAKMIHLAKNTSSHTISKSISLDGGIANYRGYVSVHKNADNAKNYTQCDALLLDDMSASNTYPTMDITNSTASVAHEASVAQLDDAKIFYMMSRGLTEAQARSAMINGFIEQITTEIPMEYSVELHRLIHYEMEKNN